MSTYLNTVNNGLGVFGPIPVNLITDTNVTIGIPANEDVYLSALQIGLRAVSVLGTLSVAGTAIVDTGTTGQNVSSSTTFTSAVTGSYTLLSIPANAKVVHGDPSTTYFRFHITANAVGQATTNRARLDNIVTITTSAPHGFSAGDVIEVRSLGGSNYNGRVQVVSVPSSTQFTYFKEGSDEGTTADTAGRVGAFDAVVWVNPLQEG